MGFTFSTDGLTLTQLFSIQQNFICGHCWVL